MIPTIQCGSNPFTHPLYAEETASIIFAFVDPKKNIKATMLVCHAWKEFATKVVKIQLISKAEVELGAKMLPFLTMTGGKLEDYCPALNEISISQKNPSVAKINELLNALTEKHTGSFGRSCIVDPDENAPTPNEITIIPLTGGGAQYYIPRLDADDSHSALEPLRLELFF